MDGALLAHIEPQVGRDLLVAAAAGVQLETQVTDASGELQLDEVVNIFSLGATVDIACRPLRVLVANGVQRGYNLLQFCGG